ncbi:MAG: hypothetical protein SCABRO_01983, partial [Candidatus Scalindua brodae]
SIVSILVEMSVGKRVNIEIFIFYERSEMSMKKQKFVKPHFALLLFFTFPMLVIGCVKNGESKVQTEGVESKQRMEKNGLNTNDADVVVINTSGSNSFQVSPVEDEIHLDEWMQLVKDIKSTLGEMEEVNRQVLQTNEPR